MSVRKIPFVNNEYYHIFNRGIDKREIFSDRYDWNRFFQSMDEFNTIDPIESIFVNSFKKKNQLRSKASKLVNFTCFCINPNHYHFILEQVSDNGIEKFMHRFGTGYTKYFNYKHERSGSLFQGKFKAIHIKSNEYLLHVSAYVNLNNKIHRLRSKASQSSWWEYKNNQNGFCDKDIILGQFKNPKEYEDFALNSLKYIQERKDMEKFLIE